MAKVLEPSKMRAASRVVEVLEYFEDCPHEATVMEIARRYNRPQSSTSELLAALAEIGLLHKNPQCRTYSPTPRMGILGLSMQPEVLRNGKLLLAIDEMVAETGQGIALSGRVGTHLQIYRWRQGEGASDHGLGCGKSIALHDDVAGQLLLSTLPSSQLSGILRRLNAEAKNKFDYPAMLARIEAMCRSDYAVGDSGLVTGRLAAALRLPGTSHAQPIVLSIHYDPKTGFEAGSLLARLRGAIALIGADQETSLRVSENITTMRNVI